MDAEEKPLSLTRDAIDTLAMMPVDELRRLAVHLDDESRIVRAMLRERTRRPARAQLHLVEATF